MSTGNEYLYLAGPMTGLPEFNHPAFNAAAQALRLAGYRVFNPAENGLAPTAPRHEHMRADIAALMQCEAVATLPGCWQSEGARLETDVAKRVGMRVAPVDAWLF